MSRKLPEEVAARLESLAAMEGAGFTAMAAHLGLDPKRSFRGADLSEVDLSGQDLAGYDLSGADLRNADLRLANLSKAKVSDINFDGSRILGSKWPSGFFSSRGLTLYHRIMSPTQTFALSRIQEKSGEIWGGEPRGSSLPSVQAFKGPLPKGRLGIEFVTDIIPAMNQLSGEVRWRNNIPGVKTRISKGAKFAVIKCWITSARYFENALITHD